MGGSSLERVRKSGLMASVRRRTASAEKSPGQTAWAGKTFPKALRMVKRRRPATTWAAVRIMPLVETKQPVPTQRP